MKIKLDENLPLQAATFLKNFGHDVHTPHDERLIGRADEEIWDAAQKDLDFSDLRRFAPGSHHGILLLRLRSPTRRSLASGTDQRTLPRRERRRMGWEFSRSDRTQDASPEAGGEVVFSR